MYMRLLQLGLCTMYRERVNVLPVYIQVRVLLRMLTYYQYTNELELVLTTGVYTGPQLHCC